MKVSRKVKFNIIDLYLFLLQDNWNAMMSFVAKTIRAVSGGELPATKRFKKNQLFQLKRFLVSIDMQ